MVLGHSQGDAKGNWPRNWLMHGILAKQQHTRTKDNAAVVNAVGRSRLARCGAADVMFDAPVSVRYRLQTDLVTILCW